jgi:hypothetical protein
MVYLLKVQGSGVTVASSRGLGNIEVRQIKAKPASFWLICLNRVDFFPGECVLSVSICNLQPNLWTRLLIQFLFRT